MTDAWTIKNNGGDLVARFVRDKRHDVERAVLPIHYDMHRLLAEPPYREQFEQHLADPGPRRLDDRADHSQRAFADVMTTIPRASRDVAGSASLLRARGHGTPARGWPAMRRPEPKGPVVWLVIVAALLAWAIVFCVASFLLDLPPN